MLKCEVILKLENGRPITVFYDQYYRNAFSGSGMATIYRLPSRYGKPASQKDDHELVTVDYCESLPDCPPDSKAGETMVQALSRRGYENIEVVHPPKRHDVLLSAARDMYNTLVDVYRATAMGETVMEDEMVVLRNQIAAALAKADGGEYR